MNLDKFLADHDTHSHCEIGSGWIVDPEGHRTPALRIHKDDTDPGTDMVVPLDRKAIRDLLGTLYQLAVQLDQAEAEKT